jgi:hypothetical protein
MKLTVTIMTMVYALALAIPAQAQSNVPAGAKIFITNMEGSLDGYIAAEILKQKVPVLVVTDEANADYILAGGSVKADHWYNSVFGGENRNEGGVKLMSVKDKAIVWAGEAGDRSLWFSKLKRNGERKVADTIVSDMKHELFKK